MKYKKHKKKTWFLLTAACLLILVFGARAAMAALENSNSTGVRSVHVSDSEIPVSTMVVGSYLIHINGISDEIYQKAQESANEFNQSQIYYKSELAGGQWFSITDASSIADITSSGTSVSKSEIESLEFTHRTDANGITTDLRTGRTVSSFDIPDPYDLESMQELEPLKIQYQLIQEKEKKSDSDEKYISMLSGFFGTSIRDSETDDCDASITALEQYKSGLSGRQKPASWTEAVESVQTHVDARRRVRSLTTLSDNLDTLLDQASGRAVSNGFGSSSLLGRLGGLFTFSSRDESSDEGDSGEAQADPDFIINSDMISAIGDASSNVETSISSYSAKILEEGTTAASKSRYRYTNDLILQTKAGNQAASDTATENLCSLDNILNGTVGDQKKELDALTMELISQALEAYKGKLSAGVDEKYGEAVAAGASEGARTQILKDQKSETDAARLEYQSMLEAAFLRMDNSSAQTYSQQLIEGVPDLRALVPQDAVSSYQLETVEAHLIWLRKELAELIKNGTDTSEMDELQSALDDLENQRRSALDDNDLAKARRLEAEAEAKKKDIDDLTRNLTEVLNSASSSEADKARALAQLGANSAASMINDLADRIISDIQDGLGDGSGTGLGDEAGSDTGSNTGDQNLSDLNNALNALEAAGGLDPNAAQGALSQIQNALDSASGLDSKIADQLASSLHQIGEGLADTASGDLSGLKEGQLLTMMENLLGGSFASASSEQQGAVIVALDRFGNDAPNQNARALAAKLANQAAESGNSYLYKKYTADEKVRISLQSVERILNYRYIFDQAHNTATLQKGKRYYLFTVQKDSCQMSGGESKKLSGPAVYSNVMYLLSEDGKQLFDMSAYYISESVYGTVVTGNMESQIQDFYDQLMGGGA